MAQIIHRYKQLAADIALRLPDDIDGAITVLELLTDMIEQASAEELGHVCHRARAS
jgi:hypothetical protein